MLQDTHTVHPATSFGSSPTGGLSFIVDRRDHEARLSVAGPLDIATQDALSRAVASVLRPPVRALLLDLDGVTFFGAAGVSALISINQAAASAEIRLVLTGIRSNVQRILDLTGTGDLIPTARTTGRSPVDRQFHRPHTEQSCPPSKTEARIPAPAASRLAQCGPTWVSCARCFKPI